MPLRPELQAELDATRATMANLRAEVMRLDKGSDPEIANLARNLAHMPVWPNGRRPDWWSNQELRLFLTESHRQMTLAECCAEVERRFNRPFSGSTLQRYWALLDKARAEQSSKREAA